MKKALAILVLMLCIPNGGLAQEQKAPVKKETHVDRYGDALPEGAIGRLGTVRFRHGLYASRIAFSPNGKLLASAGRYPGLCFWEADTGRLVRCLDSPHYAYGVEFSSDGSKLFTGRKLIEVATGKELRQFKTAFTGDSPGAFSSDGKTLASSDFDGQTANIILWDANTGKDLRALTGHRGYVNALAYSPIDTTILASASSDKTVRLWNTTTGKELHRFDGHEEGASIVTFAPDGKTLASTGEDGVARLWNVAAGKLLHQIKLKNSAIYQAAFSRDGKLLACGGAGGVISFWNPKTGKLVRQWETHASFISSLAFAPDGKTLAGSSSGAIRLWNFETGMEINPVSCHQGNVFALHFARDGKSMLSSGDDRKVLRWDLALKKDVGPLFREPLGPSGWMSVRVMDFSPDGELFAQAPRTNKPGGKLEHGPIKLWNTATGKEVHSLSESKELVRSLKFSPSGKLLASGGQSGLHIWDTVSGKERHHLLAKLAVFGVAFSPDGALLGASGSDQRIYLWDVVTGKELRSWGAGNDSTPTLEFLPDGKSIAISDRLDVRFWATDTGKEVQRITVSDGFLAMKFSPDGRIMATGSLSDRSSGGEYSTYLSVIQLWELRTGQMIREISSPQVLARSLAFAPDRRTLASGGGDSTILLWDLTGHAKTKPPAPKAMELDKLWSDLAADASKADRAHWTLALAPKQSVSFLTQRMRQLAPADAKQVADLLANLENKNIDVRQKAERLLIDLGESAEAALRKSLDTKAPLERHRRVQQILDKRDPDVLRLLRAIDVLEEIGNAETRAVLETLAKTAPNPRVAQAADAARQRLTK